jgi:magnesium-transporting ATPase (P-type)
MLGVLTTDTANPTAKAIQEFVAGDASETSVGTFVPFSSARKWAGVTINESKGSGIATSWIMGAPEVVLVDGGFASLPGVVAEGRRVIANVERVAKLFLTKTMYALVLAVATGVARVPFPFCLASSR